MPTEIWKVDIPADVPIAKIFVECVDQDLHCHELEYHPLTGAAILEIVRRSAEKRFGIKVQRRYLEWVDIGTVDHQPPLEVTAEDIDAVLAEEDVK